MRQLVTPTGAELEDLSEIHAPFDAAAEFNRLARELRATCAAARGECADDDEFRCRGGCGRPMNDAGELCAECGIAAVDL